MIIQLTAKDGTKFLLGTESIIRVKPYKDDYSNSNAIIDSREAMAITSYCKETVQEIYEMCNPKSKKKC